MCVCVKANEIHFMFHTILTENRKSVTENDLTVGTVDNVVVMIGLSCCQVVQRIHSAGKWFIDAIGVITIIHRTARRCQG